MYKIVRRKIIFFDSLKKRRWLAINILDTLICNRNLFSSTIKGLQLPYTLVAIQLTIPSTAKFPSIPLQQNTIAHVATRCPLDPSTTFTSKKWALDEVKEIEDHIQTASFRPKAFLFSPSD